MHLGEIIFSPSDAPKKVIQVAKNIMKMLHR